MLITNNTGVVYWFGPMQLPASGTLTLDDTTDTSLYLTDDSVADAVNTLQEAGMISVTDSAIFPRATGTPSLLHGDGSPEGLVYGPQGSLYLRRDSTVPSASIYTKNTGVTENVGWAALGTALTAVTGSVSSSGTAVAGTGYTSSYNSGTGIYTISFTTALSEAPLVFAFKNQAPGGANTQDFGVVAADASGFTLGVGYSGSSYEALAFNFLAIVPI